ncbi:hypothetical protein SLS58_001488 [Diplodia intermedia]|uniref:Integral membrane protein n=1 Tax=Diplodia intermedia TaxID=856260 RepID=A0ABR3U2T1_9PEZI
MSYKYPYQNYQPTYQPANYPPPPPPRNTSSAPPYDAGQQQQPPALPPRPSPTTPGTPNVQDVTAGFGRLSMAYDQRPQTYVPHADYHHQAAAAQAPPAFTWPTDHGASMSGHCYAHPAVSPVSTPSAGPPTPSSSTASQYPQQQQQQQVPVPVPMPYQPGPQQQTYYPPPPEPGRAWSPAQTQQTQQQQQGAGTPVQAQQRKAVASPSVPQPPAFVFEMEGSVPGGGADAQVMQEKRESKEKVEGPVADQAKNDEVGKEEKPPEKLQRTFTDTLRQAGPYFYVPPAVTVEEDEDEDEEHAGKAAAVPNQAGNPASDEQQPIMAATQEPLSAAHEPAESTVQPSQPAADQKLPLEGAEPFGYFLKIADAPTNIPTDQAANYSVLYKCCHPATIDYADIFWFHHVDVPDFRICGYCFEKHIRQTEFAHCFVGKMESKELKPACFFGAPRMLQQLWPQAVRARSIDQVVKYMKGRTQVTQCHGPKGVLGKDATHVRWFKMRDGEVPHLLICEACLEDQVIGTAFNDMFVPYLEPQGQEQQWSCDMALGYLRRAFAHALAVHNWSFFVTPAANRLTMPPCAEANDVEAGSREWYTPTRRIDGVVICSACYHDNLALTPLEREFTPRPVDAASTSNPWSCDFSALGVKSGFEVSLLTSSPTPLHTALLTLASTGPCAAGPLASRTWYRLAADPGVDYDICPTCHAGLFAAFPSSQLSALLAPTTTPQPTRRACDFSPSSPRFLAYARRYLAAVNQPGAAPAYAAYVARVAGVPPCARRDPVRNGRWFLLGGAGAPDLVACADCYDDAVAGTGMAGVLEAWPPGGEGDPVPRVCDMYSASMRARWGALCHDCSVAEDGGQAALQAFVAFSRHRHRVYEETVPRCRELLAAAKARAERQRVANAMSSAYHNMALMTGGYGGYGGGYGYGGGAFAGQAAAAGAQGVDLMMPGMGDTAVVRELEGRWLDVE